MSIKTRITDSAGNTLFALEWTGVTPGTPTEPIVLKLYNDSEVSTSQNYITAVRADFLEEAPASEDEEVSKTLGTEVVDNDWLEIRETEFDAWEEISAWDKKYTCGVIGSGSSFQFQVRLNPPSDAESIGSTGFAIRVLSEEDSGGGGGGGGGGGEPI